MYHGKSVVAENAFACVLVNSYRTIRMLDLPRPRELVLHSSCEDGFAVAPDSLITVWVFMAKSKLLLLLLDAGLSVELELLLVNYTPLSRFHDILEYGYEDNINRFIIYSIIIPDPTTNQYIFFVRLI